MIDQRSRTEFSMGVRSARSDGLREGPQAACAFLRSGFLMCCASSSTAVEKWISRRVSMSRRQQCVARHDHVRRLRSN